MAVWGPMAAANRASRPAEFTAVHKGIFAGHGMDWHLGKTRMDPENHSLTHDVVSASGTAPYWSGSAPTRSLASDTSPSRRVASRRLIRAPARDM